MKKLLSFLLVIASTFTLFIVANATSAITCEIYYQFNDDNSAIRLIGEIKNVNDINDLSDVHYSLTLDNTTRTEEINTVYETVSGANSSFSTKTDGVYYSVLKLTDINDASLQEKSFSFKLVVNNTIESSEKSVIFTEANDKISITESGGAFESAYLKWTPLSGIVDYNVYYKTSSTAYKAIDKMLIREYPSYYRADVLGLTEGSYDIKVVGVDKDNKEISSSEATCNVDVLSYDRSGFTFSSISGLAGGVGAYNLDGSLKSNAQVIYVTEANKATVKATVGSKEYTGVAQITQAIKDKNTSNPFAIRIIGKVTASNMSCSDLSSWYAMGVKNASNVTIEGVGDDATLYGFGVGFASCNSVEVRNLGLMNWGGGSDGDGIALQGTKNAWIHNNDIFYGDAGSDGDQVKGDGSMDLKNDSKYVTISYNHFYDSGKMSLCGMKSESGENFITYHHNWFDHSDSRHPRVRTMSVHVYNNYYDGNSKYGMATAYGANIFSEGNYFSYCKKPYLIGGQGSETELSGEKGSVIKAYNDYIASCGQCIVYTDGCGTNFDVYAVEARDEVIPNTIVTAGGYTYNNFDTNYDLGVNPENIDTPEEAKNNVIAYSGRMNGGDVSWTFNESENENYNPISELKAMLNNYQSKLVRTLGDNQTVLDDIADDNGDAGTPEVSTPVISGLIIHNFTESGKESDFFTISGNLSTDKGQVAYNDLTLTQCLKIESSTSISFTTSSQMTLILVFNSGFSNAINIDGIKNTVTNGILEISLDAGSHTITKKDTANLYYMVLTK